MKLHEHIQRHMNLVSRYGPAGIEVNGMNHARPLILAPGFIHADWIAGPEQLTPESLAPLWPLDPRVVLVGATGVAVAGLKSLRSFLATRQVALEVMDLGAACRTYNVLAQEERQVVALLFPS
ncbi:MAG: Mth938-like domain-containing protein [Pseudomonadota bacterium]|jgi:uncharacterized protein|nr:MAG: hypothetical protein DIU62_15430 [Pseudomonadota bacterium]